MAWGVSRDSAGTVGAEACPCPVSGPSPHSGAWVWAAPDSLFTHPRPKKKLGPSVRLVANGLTPTK